MIKKIIFILFVVNIYAYQICESDIYRSYKIICLNGDEFFRYGDSYSGGMAKTGYKCKCVCHKKFIGEECKVKRVK